MRFLDPEFLVLAFAALLPWVGPLRTADTRHALIRSLALLLIAVALARPVQVLAESQEHRVLVIDRTASVTDASDDAARLWVQGAVASEEAADTTWTVVEIGGAERPALELPTGVRRVALASPLATATTLGTALGAALDAAARILPEDVHSRVTLLSDGLSTGDPFGADDAAAFEDLTSRRVPVDFVELAGVAGDLRPVSLDPRGPSRVGLVTELEARIIGGGQVVTCRLVGPDGELDRAENVLIDGDTRLGLSFEPEAAGFLDLALEIDVTDGVDPRPGDERFERTLCVQDALRVLYLGERVAGGSERLAELVGRGFDVQDAGADVSAADLDGADLVVLDDRPAKSLPEALQDSLVERVSSGGLGLLAAGGEAAFGPGGYHDSPIERLLPVEFVQKEEKRDPSTTLVVDSSQSA